MSIVKFLLPLILVLATCWAQNPIFEEVQPFVFEDIPTDYRLPDSGVKPVNYEISLQPYFEDVPEGKKEFSFDGSVKITLERTNKEIKKITLHASKLIDMEAYLEYEIINKEDEQENITLKAIIEKDEMYEDRDFIILSFEKDIPEQPNIFFLTFTYTGTLMHEDLRGFYRSSYGEENDKEWLATTQFEPVDARRAFPCWDEPEIKATFEITIIHPSDYTAISNMQEKEPKESKTQDDDDLVTTQFEKTNIMSTYLVAFVISKFEYASNEENNFFIWTKHSDNENVMYALDNGPKILSELEDYTGFKYYKAKNNVKSMEMEKMAQVSIPDFWAGAMENWGLVTYREPLLLYKENVTTTQNMQDIITIIAHELAHQWFGNLVTPKWWDHIWLNEGFATFFQYYIADSVEENWRLMDQFVVKNMQESAFVTDANINTRKMSQDAATPAQIKSLFDDIAYKKGACICRMLQHILTDEKFKTALRQYLSNKDNMYNSVTPKELFAEMQKVADDKKADKKKINLPHPLEQLMKNWIEKPGYPVVTIELNDKKKEMIISQQRFLLSGPSSTDKTKWYIPINYVTEDKPKIEDTKAILWTDTTNKPYSYKPKDVDMSKWVIVNNLQSGFYRVNYDERNWKNLANYLDSDNFEKINPVSRAQLIDDSMNLARAGYIPYTRALPNTLYLYREVDYIPWYTFLRNLNFLNHHLQGMSNYKDFQKYVVQKMETYVKEVELTDTPTNSTHMYQLGRELMLQESCKYGHEGCKAYTLESLKAWLNDKKELPADLRDGILCAGVRQADQTMWNMTLQMYKNSTNPSEKKAILNALGCVQDEKVIQTFLELSLDDEPVIDLFDALNTISKNNQGSFDVLIDFINDNIEKIQKKDEDKSKLTTHANQLATTVVNNEQYGKLALLAVREHVEIENFVGMISGRDNLDWIEKNQQVISDWIKENYNEPKTGGNSATSITAMSFLTVISVLIARFY